VINLANNDGPDEEGVHFRAKFVMDPKEPHEKPRDNLIMNRLRGQAFDRAFLAWVMKA
jgi:hypothetical protein